MIEPTKKNPAIDNLLTSITKISRKDAMQKSICTWCKKPVQGFRDQLSKQEYRISGMCQSCQDDTFGGEE